MRRLLAMSGILLFALSLNSQSLSPQVVTSSGNSFLSPTDQLDFTIGEVITSSFINSDNCLTHGFHQPEILITAVKNIDKKYSFRLYPNPTEQYVTVESPQETEMQVRVYDALGNTVEVSNVFTQKTTIDLQKLVSGNYILVITNVAGKPFSSYTLYKN